MLILRAYTSEGEVILHCRGHCDRKRFGFINGEGIFELKEKDASNFHVVRQVGYVEIRNKPSFNYTDAAFKQSIKYNEETGYSTMDGGAWAMHDVDYLDSEGKINHEVKAPSIGMGLYISAKNPFTYIPNIHSFFSGFVETESEQHVPESQMPQDNNLPTLSLTSVNGPE